MTIAAGYLCSEGIVLGADSTATFMQQSGNSNLHYNHMQKVYEIGEGSSLGIVTWGVGGLGQVSFRTLIARLGDSLRLTAPRNVSDVAWRWSTLVWSEHASYFAAQKPRYLELVARGNQATDEEKKELVSILSSTQTGFCVAGISDLNRTPEAYEVWIGRDWDKPESPQPLQFAYPKFWGWSNVIDRLRYGMDAGVFQKILDSGKWHGTGDELIQVMSGAFLGPPGPLPIRDAIDWVYSSIQATIKAYKFSKEMPACGGPIEVAVITTDRRFRWVTHKPLNSSLE